MMMMMMMMMMMILVKEISLGLETTVFFSFDFLHQMALNGNNCMLGCRKFFLRGSNFANVFFFS